MRARTGVGGTVARLVALAAVMAVLATLAGCASRPVAAKRSDPRLPAGWARFSFGSLSVGAPSGWKVSRAEPLCGSPTKTVDEYVVTSVRPVNCPAIRPTTGAVQAVAIQCARGKAARAADTGPPPLPGSPAATVRVDGHLLHRDASSVSLQGHGWTGVVWLPVNFGPPTLGAQILATVEPTGKPC